jgi:hypothetical protein
MTAYALAAGLWSRRGWWLAWGTIVVVAWVAG